MGYTRKKKKIVIINNEKKKTATKCGIGVTPLIDSHPLETSKSYQKRKKKNSSAKFPHMQTLLIV